MSAPLQGNHPGWLAAFSFTPQEAWVGELPPPDGHDACLFTSLLTQLQPLRQAITASLWLPFTCRQPGV